MKELKPKLYYIKAQYYPVGDCVLFWCIGGHGYTCDLNKAWKVTREQGERILDHDRNDELLPVDEVDTLAYSHFDFQNLEQISERIKTPA